MFNHNMQENEFHVGTNSYINPQNIYNNLNLTPTENESQYESYKKFVYNKNVYKNKHFYINFKIDNSDYSKQKGEKNDW